MGGIPGGCWEAVSRSQNEGRLHTACGKDAGLIRNWVLSGAPLEEGQLGATGASPKFWNLGESLSPLSHAARLPQRGQE